MFTILHIIHTYIFIYGKHVAADINMNHLFGTYADTKSSHSIKNPYIKIIFHHGMSE